MAKSNPHMRPGNAAQDSDISHAGTAPVEETFPPLSTSLAAFVKDGSDREFRRLIYDLLGLANLMRFNADRFARYIGRNKAQFYMMVIIADTPDVAVRPIAPLTNLTRRFVTTHILQLITE